MVNLKLNDEYMALAGASLGSKIFHDDSKTLSTLTKELAGAYLPQLSSNDVRNNSFSVSCSKACSVILATWNGEMTNIGGEDQWTKSYLADGWILKKEQRLRWEKEYKNPGETKSVISKTISANHTLFFNKLDDGLPITIFVIQGNKNIPDDSLVFNSKTFKFVVHFKELILDNLYAFVRSRKVFANAV